MGVSQPKDGTFFVLWEDLVNLFDMVDICKINDNANLSNWEGDFSRKNA
jgi:hypothetical protein